MRFNVSIKTRFILLHIFGVCIIGLALLILLLREELGKYLLGENYLESEDVFSVIILVSTLVLAILGSSVILILRLVFTITEENRKKHSQILNSEINSLTEEITQNLSENIRDAIGRVMEENHENKEN